MELLDKFGIDWRTLIAQVVNFLIVMFVLYRFAYKPVLKMLADRSQKIEDSLKKAQSIEEKFAKIEHDKQVIINHGKKEAQKILQDAEKLAQENSAALLAKTKAQVKDAVDKARAEINAAKENLLFETKGDLAKIIQASLEKIVQREVQDQDNEKLVKKVIEEVYSEREKK